MLGKLLGDKFTETRYHQAVVTDTLDLLWFDNGIAKLTRVSPMTSFGQATLLSF